VAASKTRDIGVEVFLKTVLCAVLKRQGGLVSVAGDEMNGAREGRLKIMVRENGSVDVALTEGRSGLLIDAEPGAAARLTAWLASCKQADPAEKNGAPPAPAAPAKADPFGRTYGHALAALAEMLHPDPGSTMTRDELTWVLLMGLVASAGLMDCAIPPGAPEMEQWVERLNAPEA
jgi:hypothetical protein